MLLEQFSGLRQTLHFAFWMLYLSLSTSTVEWDLSSFRLDRSTPMAEVDGDMNMAAESILR